MIVLILTISCQAQTTNSTDIRILHINPVIVDQPAHINPADQAMYDTCKTWQLSKEQVTQFFKLSETYPENPYSHYYQIPCKITGSLQTQGQTWRFTIEGGATGAWQQGNSIKYFGCHQEACTPLVIMPTDDMNPDD